MKKPRDELILTLKPRKEIRQMGWGVRWRSSKIDFYHTKKEAQAEIDYWPSIKCVLFRCKIEEVTK